MKDPLDLIIAVERRRQAKIAQLGSDHCRVCGYSNVFKLVKHHPEGRSASPDYWEVWCVYCHEAYDPWAGDPRTKVSRPSASVRWKRAIEGAKASCIAQLYELDAIQRELEEERG